MTTTSPHIHRFFVLDALRVFAIVMMIVFHFVYDLKYFGYVDWDTPLGNGFRQWRSFIVFCFIFTMGLSMGIAHGRTRRHRKFLIRLSQIFFCAVTITVMSLFMFPKSWIYFGILHFMVIASLFTFALIGRPRLSLLIGTVIIAAFWLGWVPYGWPLKLIPNLPSYTEDFVSPFPWFGVSALGLGLGELFIKNEAAVKKMAAVNIRGHIGNIIGFAGKRSLIIYMLHQPILFAIFIAANMIR